jgi:hypothetical protein
MNKIAFHFNAYETVLLLPGIKMTTRLLLTPSSTTHGALPTNPLCAFKARCLGTGTNLYAIQSTCLVLNMYKRFWIIGG